MHSDETPVPSKKGKDIKKDAKLREGHGKAKSTSGDSDGAKS